MTKNLNPQSDSVDDKLTAKQQRFVDEFLLDLNASQAALRAGYKHPDIGRQLLTKPHVREAIEAAKAGRAERTQINADWVLTRLAAMASADLRKILDEKGRVLPPEQWPDDVAATVTAVDVQGDGSVTKVRRADPLRVLELLGKHVGVQAFNERMTHGVDESLAQRILDARRRARIASPND